MSSGELTVDRFNLALAKVAERISLLPKDVPRDLSISDLAKALARVYDGTRVSDNPSFPDYDRSISAFLEKHSIEIPGGLTVERLNELFFERIRADKVYDSEYAQGCRAMFGVLSELQIETVKHTGWLRNTTVRTKRGIFTLTGNACPRCEVNPVCLGADGGIRCLDVDSCRWWFCY